MDSDRHRKIDYRYIADNFSSLDQVISALRHEGLESSNLILGIDFTKSNEWTGRYSFRRKSLHSVSSIPNPYEQAISIIGHTLSPFDDDGLIPCFGFGDASTCDQHVFSFYPDHRPCKGFKEALFRYREILPYLNLSGPTSFAPVIDAAIGIVEKSNWQYHVLVIIADGQVTRNPKTPPGKLSSQEQATINSIVAASYYPLSIILIGVGDGPWDAMHKFDDNMPQRAFDNFQMRQRRKQHLPWPHSWKFHSNTEPPSPCQIQRENLYMEKVRGHFLLLLKSSIMTMQLQSKIWSMQKLKNIVPHLNRSAPYA
ncbi:E3 ubiquitin-protein ligase RGLG3 isoform X3 [Cucumis melo]|uniref:E3 ubiquitin-protein ligase RGLG3 isoform X3 n=1 Tax=Cucumis melo TaxID=3656 RepID=A0ABM3L4S2_CUCME|nr:E3 ubiquitin-protein ligase RGLG3 isoform X3 [Cucumis melo]